MVEARDRVACPAPEPGQGGGAADPRQQQVRAGIVAEFDDRLAHIRNRHGAFLGALGKVLFRDRRVIENILGPIRDHVLKTILSIVDPRQREGGQ